MEKINGTIKIYVQIIVFLSIWASLLYAFGIITTFEVGSAIKKIPLAITIYILFATLFTRWMWRIPILQGWLIKVPNIQGTWRGELKSDWINPETNAGIAPIPVILVIKQTFSEISCTLMTKESTSYSMAAEINKAYGGDELYLSYNYTNRSRIPIRDRSAIHDGAALLKITKQPSPRLEGDYWTSRKTRGEISLSFEGKKLVERFS